MRSSASCPTATAGIEVSSTSISGSTTDMSEMVSSTVPGLFCTPMTATSPSSTRRAVTTPSMGERTVVFASVSRAPSSVARACSARCWTASSDASAVASAVRARCTSASGAMPALTFTSARSASILAWSRVARAESMSLRSACIENCELMATARGLVASIWSSNCPFLTTSPSSTARWVIWPGMVAEISTLRCACTLPLAVTFACRSSRPTVASCTAVGLGPRLAKNSAAPPPITATAIAAMIQRFRRFAIRALDGCSAAPRARPALCTRRRSAGCAQPTGSPSFSTTAVPALRSLVWLLAALAAAAPQARLAPGNHRVTLHHDGRARRYLVHVPPAAASGRALPVLLSFHGAGGSPAGHQRFTQTDSLADRKGFLVVYPEGTDSGGLLVWNAGTCCGPRVAGQVDDVGFALAVVDDLARRVTVDPHRLYATGISNGGMMAHRLAAEASTRVAAIAPVAGGLVYPRLAPGRPVPVLHIHSLDDPIALYRGGLRGRLAGVERMNPNIDRMMARWAAADGCTG